MKKLNLEALVDENHKFGSSNKAFFGVAKSWAWKSWMLNGRYLPNLVCSSFCHKSLNYTKVVEGFSYHIAFL